jgi:ribonuclease HII
MIGIDEVGRGCWAGPLLVVAARELSQLPEELTDSKLLSKKQRENIFINLQKACEFGEGWVSSQEIDKIGLAEALKLGIKRALKELKAIESDEIVLDGAVNYIEKKFKNAKCIVDADLNIPIVSAASIYAKVLRDNYMIKISKKYPNYGFDKHVGYGTKVHIQALADYGVIKEFHRFSYKPIKMYVK